MSKDIYTFSGTGNSLAVARDIAAGLGARLIPIPAVMDRERVVIEADVVGIVFPVHHKSIPLIIKRFVEMLEIREETYTFAACTYGDTPGLAVEHLRRLLSSQGGRLDAGFGVHMPYNYLKPSPVLRGFFRSFKLREVPAEKQQALVAGGREKAEAIAASVGVRASHTFETTSDGVTRLADALNLPEILAKPIWLRVAGVTEVPDVPFIESRQMMDHAFRADAACNGCRICSRICPVGNIEMIDDDDRPHQVPAWQHRCEQCFACLHWCPEQAIQFGSTTAGQPRYHHPDIRLADMVQAASIAEA